jgi:hypothetical protein
MLILKEQHVDDPKEVEQRVLADDFVATFRTPRSQGDPAGSAILGRRSRFAKILRLVAGRRSEVTVLHILPSGPLRLVLDRSEILLPFGEDIDDGESDRIAQAIMQTVLLAHGPEPRHGTVEDGEKLRVVSSSKPSARTRCMA